ncbi:hypothetical protein [Bombiscardovia coagulans]|uniref:hypothetical protein n=1 Tax=Bombiscardovia coagulans TaxID=686666 RepID=UPI00131465BB|nr:hypothetical protein [Bombiscardovia coagulans]
MIESNGKCYQTKMQIEGHNEKGTAVRRQSNSAQQGQEAMAEHHTRACANGRNSLWGWSLAPSPTA